MPARTDILEALLFASDTPLELARLREVLELPSVAAARELVEELSARYTDRGLQIVEVGGGYCMVTRPELAAVAEHGEAEAQQDPGAGGADVPAGS